MNIRNASQLGGTPERKAALQILDAALEAVDIDGVMQRSVRLEGHKLHLGDGVVDVRNFDRIFVVGAGKASGRMAAGIERVLGNKITDGVVIDVTKTKLKRITCVVGSHPLPSATNQRGSRAIRKLITNAGAGALIICLVSGGGSVLLADPHASIASAQRTVTKLLHSGATIHEINTVRKHLYSLAGGNLSAVAYPARVMSLIVSDVVGDDPALIASGPTTYDESTVGDAKRILRKHKASASGLRETPKEQHLFHRTNNSIILSPHHAVEAMVKRAHELRLEPIVLSTTLQGEARLVAKVLVDKLPPRPRSVVLAGGETTVTVHGKGKGGRNQELALSASQLLDGTKHVCLASMGTDGIDNSDVAGAIVDGASAQMAKRKKLDAKKALDGNDSYPFFKKLGKHHIITGPTGTNVADVMVVVRGPLR